MLRPIGKTLAIEDQKAQNLGDQAACEVNCQRQLQEFRLDAEDGKVQERKTFGLQFGLMPALHEQQCNNGNMLMFGCCYVCVSMIVCQKRSLIVASESWEDLKSHHMCVNVLQIVAKDEMANHH